MRRNDVSKFEEKACLSHTCHTCHTHTHTHTHVTHIITNSLIIEQGNLSFSEVVKTMHFRKSGIIQRSSLNCWYHSMDP